MDRLGLAAVLLCSAACAAGPPPASRPAPERAATTQNSTPPPPPSPDAQDAPTHAPPQSAASPTPPEPPDSPSPAPTNQPIIERDGPYVVERSGDRTCIGFGNQPARLCGSRPQGPRTKLELSDVRGGLDRAAAWQGLMNVQSASKRCWDEGPDDVVEARVFVGPRGDVQSAGTSREGEVAACMLPLLRAATFPRVKESTRVSVRLIRVP